MAMHKKRQINLLISDSDSDISQNVYEQKREKNTIKFDKNNGYENNQSACQRDRDRQKDKKLGDGQNQISNRSLDQEEEILLQRQIADMIKKKEEKKIMQQQQNAKMKPFLHSEVKMDERQAASLSMGESDTVSVDFKKLAHKSQDIFHYKQFQFQNYMQNIKQASKKLKQNQTMDKISLNHFTAKPKQISSNPNLFDNFKHTTPNSSFNPNLPKPPARIAFRQLIGTQHTSKIGNIPVYFPFKPYDIQLKYMESVIQALDNRQNGLLESPTGTGKTLCLLCSVLSWVDYHMYVKKSVQKVTIIYCSRTHSQLRQVQSELQKTCFRPTMANFGSRDQFCIKPQFSGIKGRDLMQSCSKAVKIYLKSKRKLELQPPQSSQPTQPSSPQKPTLSCSFYRSESEYNKILQQSYLNKIVTSEQIIQQGKSHHFCPYYYPFQNKTKADIIFMPYNYILDVDRLGQYQDIVKNGIVIFDEAHNVPEAACQGRSFEIYERIFQNIESEMKKMQLHPSMSNELRRVAYEYDKIREIIVKELFHVKKQLEALTKQVYNKNSTQNRFSSESPSYNIQQIYQPQAMKVLIYSWFCPEHIKNMESQFHSYPLQKKKSIYIKTVTHLNQIVKYANDLIQALKQTYDGVFQNLQKFISFASKCLQLIEQSPETSQSKKWHQKQVSHYRLSLSFPPSPSSPSSPLPYILKLVCLTPTLTFSDLLDLSPHSILLTSGTLNPLSSWQRQLSLPFSIKLQNKHVINTEQLHMAIVTKSINGIGFNFGFDQMKKCGDLGINLYGELLGSIVGICEHVPNGVLVIFPSYRIIKGVKDQMMREVNGNGNGVVGRLRKLKNICFEDKGTNQHVIENFKKKAKTNKGAVLFCVCRGKVSEGLDLSDQMCRAVIFVGVPFPNIKDPILKQKRDYYTNLSRSTNKCISGDQWYTLNTMRAVNQGIGRVIRHINDFGMIFLLDNRYEQNKLKNMLPQWAKSNMAAYANFRDVEEKVEHFFKEMRQKFGVREVKQEIEQQNQDQDQNKHLKKGKVRHFFNKQQKKEQKNDNKKNPIQQIMDQARRNSLKNPPKKAAKKKDVDFL